MKRYLTEGEVAYAIEEHARKVSVNVIAKSIGTHWRVVERELRSRGVQPRLYGRNVKSLSPDERDQIATSYLDNNDPKEIADAFNISKRSLFKVLSEDGVSRPGSRSECTDTEVQAMVRLWDEGSSVAEIARQLKRAPRTVSLKLRACGIKVVQRRPDLTGPNSPRWTGGRRLEENGYVLVWLSPDDPFHCMTSSGGNYVPEHRLVMARALGRPLRDYEEVHHINTNRQDNRLENLQLRIKKHGAGGVFRCCDCGSQNIEPLPLP